MENKRKLSDGELSTVLAQLPGWSVEAGHLHKIFVFANYAEINRFLPHLTGAIVRLNHHPDFAFDSGRRQVSVKMTTHSAGGLTQADVDLAMALEAWRQV